MKTKEEKQQVSSEFVFTAEWIRYLLLLCALAILYIYLTHRTDNIVRDIEKAKKNLVELRAENITLKSEIIQKRSRANIEQRLEGTGLAEPNRVIMKVKAKQDER